MKAKTIILTTGFLLFAFCAAIMAADAFWAQATDVRGDVAFFARGAKQGKVLQRGMVLHVGDIVKTAKGARASFLMSDGRLFVLSGEKKVVINASRKANGPSLRALAANLSGTLLSREGDNPMLKHLAGLRGGRKNLALAPRRTAVRGEKVTLVWLPQLKTKEYIVSIMDPSGDISEFRAGSTRADVPLEKLKSSGTYYWEVRAAARPEALTAAGSGRFSVLTDSEMKMVNDLLNRIHKAFPKGNAKTDSTPLFLSYQVFRENGLTLDALKTLQEMIKLNPGDSQLAAWRHDLCDEMGISEKDVHALIAGSR